MMHILMLRVEQRSDAALQDERGVYRFVCDDPKGATFRHLTLQPPCMLWCAVRKIVSLVRG
jgi:hypothetical protein